MNKKNLLFIFFAAALLLVSFTVFEQKSYIDYHREINKVDLLLQAEKYTDALAIYGQLEKTYPHFFSKDLHNAYICAILSKKYKKAEKYALEMVLHGYKLEDFEKPVSSELKDKKEWKSFLSKYDKQREDYLNDLDTTARKAYAELFVKDQEIASNRTVDIKKQDAGFVHVEKEMLNLINQHGFPTYMIDKDTIEYQLYIIFRHICGMRNANLDIEHPIKEILFTALEDGYVSPEQYSSIVSYRGENYYGDLSISIDFKEGSVKLRPMDNMEEINKRRESIGLFPLDTVATSNYLMNSWYGKIPFEKILQKKMEVDQTNSSQKEFIEYVSGELEKARKQYENEGEDGETNYFILPKPEMAKSTYYYFD